MENIKKNLPQILIGTAAAAAIALGIYYYQKEGVKETSPSNKQESKPKKKWDLGLGPPAEEPVPDKVPLPTGLID